MAGQRPFQAFLAAFLIVIGSLEQRQVVEHVMNHVVQPGIQLGSILDLLLQPGADILQAAIQQRLHHLAAQRRQRLVHHPFQRPGFLEIKSYHGTQFLLRLLDCCPTSFRQ